MALDAQTIVDVVSRTAVSGVVKRQYGVALLISDTSGSEAGKEYADYASFIADVADEGTRRVASRFFSQVGAKNLVLMKAPAAGESSRIIGGALPAAATLARINALADRTITLGDESGDAFGVVTSPASARGGALIAGDFTAIDGETGNITLRVVLASGNLDVVLPAGDYDDGAKLAAGLQAAFRNTADAQGVDMSEVTVVIDAQMRLMISLPPSGAQALRITGVSLVNAPAGVAIDNFGFAAGDNPVFTDSRVDLPSTFVALAGALATGISALDGVTATVAWNGAQRRFTVTFSDGALYPIFDDGPMADILGLSDAGGGEFVQGGIIGATLADAEARYTFSIVLTDDDYRLASKAPEIDAISAWCEANECGFFHETNDADNLTSDTGRGRVLAARGRERTVITHSVSPDGKAGSIAGFVSSINWDGIATVPTLKFKRLPGCTPDQLTPGDARTLDGARINYYVTVGGTPIYQQGVSTAPGLWADVRFALDWFSNAVRTALLDALVAAPTKVPQTDAGIAVLHNAVDGVCRAAVRNGMIAAGTVSPALRGAIQQATGDPDFNGVLSTGYLIAIGSLADQSQADRAARKAPPIRVFLKGSGAVHFVNADLTFED